MSSELLGKKKMLPWLGTHIGIISLLGTLDLENLSVARDHWKIPSKFRKIHFAIKKYLFVMQESLKQQCGRKTNEGWTDAR